MKHAKLNLISKGSTLEFIDKPDDCEEEELVTVRRHQLGDLFFAYKTLLIILDEEREKRWDR